MSLVCEEGIQVKVKIDTGADTNTLTKRAWALIREAVITNGVTKLNEQRQCIHIAAKGVYKSTSKVFICWKSRQQMV